MENHNNNDTAEEEEETAEVGEEQLGSSSTLERVAVAKQFIENHYKSHMKHIKERRERYHQFASNIRMYLFVYV